MIPANALDFVDPHPVNSAFSAEIPGLQLAWDSTSMGALKTCPRYYFYMLILGAAPRGENAHLKFGIEFHAALELYDRRKALGEDHNTCVLAAVKQCLINTWNFKLKRPWASDEPTKTRETLVRSVVWYLDQFSEDPLETAILSDGKPAVELSFKLETGLRASSGEEILLCGHLDRVAHWQGKTWIVDRKSTQGSIGGEYFQKYTPDNQMSTYDFAGTIIYPEPMAGLIIDAAQVGVNYTRFQRGIVSRTQSQRDEWFKDFEIWTKLAEAFAKAQYWPQNDRACNMYGSYNRDENSWRGGCPFKGICGISPEVREPHLRGLYDTRIWNPLVTREV